jgi:hypothetical protein
LRIRAMLVGVPLTRWLGCYSVQYFITFKRITISQLIFVRGSLNTWGE